MNCILSFVWFYIALLILGKMLLNIQQFFLLINFSTVRCLLIFPYISWHVSIFTKLCVHAGVLFCNLGRLFLSFLRFGAILGKMVTATVIELYLGFWVLKLDTAFLCVMCFCFMDGEAFGICGTIYFRDWVNIVFRETICNVQFFLVFFGYMFWVLFNDLSGNFYSR